MTRQNSKVQIIIVLYKTPKKEVQRLKKQIHDLGFMNYEIYFVDNTKNNRGYGGGVNEGIKKLLIANCQLLIVCNPDISFKNLKAEDFIKLMKHFDIGGFAFKQKSKIYFGGKIDKWDLSGGLSSNISMYQYIEKDFVSGSLMVIKPEVIKKIGLFDESYFMYYEDVDYCLRAKKAGYKVGIDTKNIYEHFELSKQNSQKENWLAKSHEKFFGKYASIWQKIYLIMKQRFWTSQNDQRGFFINFLSLNFSSFFNKFLNFFLFIFLIRYLSPANYGIYVLTWAFVDFFSPFVDFGTTSYGLTYLRQEKESRFHQLISLRFFLSLIIFFIITPFSLLFFPKQFDLSLFIFFVSVVVFANTWSGSYLIITSLKEKIYKSAVLSVIFNALLISFLIFAVIAKQKFIWIFIISGFGYLIYSLINYFFVKRELKQLNIQLNFPFWRPILKKSFFFVLISFFSGLYFKQDVFLLKYLKSDQIVGIYSAGYKFLEALILIAGSYSLASLPIFSGLINEKEKFIKRIKRGFILIFLLGVAISVIFYFFSSYFLSFFLKAKYTQSLEAARILVFSLPLILGTTVFFNTLYVLGKVQTVIKIYFFQIIINFGLNLIFIPKYSFFASAYITIFCELLNLAMGYYFVQKHFKNEDRS